MAKNPTLTVNVNSQQFQQFARQFNAFSGQIKQLNQQFAQINASIQKSNMAIRALTASTQALLNVTKSVASTAARVTGHFVKWSTIIGGVTTLLGLGGGLFGIERLAASILNKRRQVLGLGGSSQFGAVQAGNIYRQSYLDNPMGSLQAVQRGLGGSPEELKGLMVSGVPFGTRMPPSEVLDKIIDKTMDVVKHAAPGTELMVTHAMGLDKFFSESDIMRMTTEEGRKEILEKREMIKAHEKELTLSARAQKGWADLELQFQIAKAQMENIFGEKLRDLAKPLEHLSEGFVHLIQVLMKSPAVAAIIKKLGEGIEWLADKLKNLTEKDIDDFIKKIKGWLPTMEQFKSAMKEFVDILQGAVNLLRWLTQWKDPVGAAATATGASGIHDFLQKNMPWASDQSIKNFFTGGNTQAPSTTAPAPAPNAPAPNAPNAPNAPAPAPAPNAPNAPAPAPAPNAPSFGAGATPFNTYGPAGRQTGAGATGFSWLNSLPGGNPTAGTFSPSAPSPFEQGKNLLKQGKGYPIGGGPGAGGLPPGWNGATQKMAPTPGGGGFLGRLPSIMGTDPGLKPGPLSMNNWQMTRQASLTIRNVPGSNIFMSAQGMTG